MSTDRFAEILNYLSAMSREIGLFRTEANDRLGRLEMRMDGVESRMDRLEAEMQAGFEKIHRGIRRMREKFESVTEALADVSLDNRDLVKRVEVIEKKVGIEEP